MIVTNELAGLAADFTGWHIWRGRSASGLKTDWHATGRPGRGERKAARLAAADAEALRALLAQHEALRTVAAA